MSTILTREQLYDRKVWARPMVHIAAEYGLSDRGLGKLCTRHEIPVPPRGYWAKKAHGHKVQTPPLAAPSHARLNHIEINPPPRPPAQVATDEAPEIAYERRPENHITVSPQANRLHRLVRQTRGALRGLKVGDRGLLFAPGPCLDVCVSPAQVPRALRLMDALVRALEARGYAPALLDKGRGLFVTVLRESLSIVLEEKTKQTPRTPTEWDRWSMDHGYRRSDPYDLKPSGILCLRIGRESYRRNDLVDSARTPLEENLNRFMIRLVKTAIREKAEREDRERWKREQEELERQRRERERLRQEEEKRERQWDEWMAAWAKSQQIRAFAAAVRVAFDPIESDDKIAQWITWAAAYADRNDPLREAKAPAAG